MTDEILVVDDQVDTANALARYISVSTGISAIATSDPSEAAQLVRDKPVKVAVLDQRMPEMTGLQLSTVLREVNDKLRLIMFTGQASTAEVADAAYNKNFNEVLEKAQVERLGEVVYQQYLLYQIEARRIAETATVIIRSRPLYRLFGPRVTYSLSDLFVLHEEHIEHKDWETVLQLSRGQEDKRTWNWSTKRSVTVEKQSQEAFKSTLKGRLTSPLGFVESAIEEALTELQKETYTVETSAASSHEVTLKLSDNDTDVRARHFQRAAVYRQWIAVIDIACDCCGGLREERMIVNERLPLFATRQVDYLEGGSRVYNTGLIRAAYVPNDKLKL
ncbi:response regulator [Asanoa sp. NPDC050611]|uniref:response regulator n=1 Tax=Asanoa sp. NPDC050611 TaxID=3157098 RepID=UPI0033E0A9C9